MVTTKHLLAALVSVLGLGAALPATAQDYAGDPRNQVGDNITVRTAEGAFVIQRSDPLFEYLIARPYGFRPGFIYSYTNRCDQQGCLVLEFSPWSRRPTDHFFAPAVQFDTTEIQGGVPASRAAPDERDNGPDNGPGNGVVQNSEIQNQEPPASESAAPDAPAPGDAEPPPEEAPKLNPHVTPRIRTITPSGSTELVQPSVVAATIQRPAPTHTPAPRTTTAHTTPARPTTRAVTTHAPTPPPATQASNAHAPTAPQTQTTLDTTRPPDDRSLLGGPS